ncbi:MAG: sulfate respiration complex protein HmcD [Thermodesulfobacteriota bacterium]
MPGAFYTLQDFMAHTKSVSYLLVVAILLGMIGFWMFLSDRDDN